MTNAAAIDLSELTDKDPQKKMDSSRLSKISPTICLWVEPKMLFLAVGNIAQSQSCPAVSHAFVPDNLTEFPNPTDGFQHKQIRFTDLLEGEPRGTCFGWFCEWMNGSIVWAQRYH